ncbi:MAG TPA: hypothetical protein VHK06_06535 [Candidatus Limnocylindria bacterium]|nr:hypothetical protein [Candidatus Limnocylindria bacterium]
MTACAAHRHRWIGVDFYLDDGHPFLRQSCGCGATRSLRAWEHYWRPDAGGDISLDGDSERPSED